MTSSPHTGTPADDAHLAPIMNAEELAAKVGTEIGLSDWVTVTQEMINQFADATGDHQFIHVDPERAALTPMGGTIAHGFLTLSLMPMLSASAHLPRPAGLKMGLNYGGNKVRFLAPVRSGSRVRGRFKLLSFETKGPGQYLQAVEYVLEMEGVEKPALIAEWLSLIFAD